jgi:hypothetical protein
MNTKSFAFILTMPGSPSWNGKWSGDGQLYARITKTRSKKIYDKLKDLEGNYGYRWDDGWCANVRVVEVDSSQARDIRKNSRGFAGYDWMIDSIKNHGHITIGNG